MRQKSVHPKSASERIVKSIRRATRKRHSSEEKIRIVLDGLRGETPAQPGDCVFQSSTAMPDRHGGLCHGALLGA